jgi:hypothetical protein
MRLCYKCKIEKEETEFYPSQLKKKSVKCKSCTRQYYEDNKPKIQKYKIEYWQQNKEELYEYKKEWRKEYANVLKRCNIHDIDYYSEECPVCSGIRKKNYNKEHEEELKEYGRIYTRKNKDKINRSRRDRRKNDPEYNIRRIVSSSVYGMIRSQSSSKNGSIISHLSYSLQDLKDHLEAQFEPWMSWNNWGKYNAKTWDDNDPSTWTWNIDHIIPHSDLPYTSMTDENFRKSWALSNLRPLSAKQNLLDGVNKTRHRK